MSTSILIVTYGRDFPWLKWCLRSITKFATGFHEVVIAIPTREPWDEVLDVINEYDGSVNLRLYPFDEWPGKGFVHHASLICHADKICQNVQTILHMDADCIFIEPVTPDSYFVDGKPVLIGARYDWIVQKFNNPNHYKWQEAVDLAVGWKPEQEWMRRHPAVHYREVYEKTRELIESHTKMVAADYIRTTKNVFPQTFAEFPLLGEVAWKRFHDRYHFLDQEKDPWPKDKLIQMWSHGPMDKPMEVWIGGNLTVQTPMELFKQYLS